MKKLLILTAVLALVAVKSTYAQSGRVNPWPLDINASPMTLLDYSNPVDSTNLIEPAFIPNPAGSGGDDWIVQGGLWGSPAPGVSLTSLTVYVNCYDKNNDLAISESNDVMIGGDVDVDLWDFDWSLYHTVSFEWVAEYSDNHTDDLTMDWTD